MVKAVEAASLMEATEPSASCVETAAVKSVAALCERSRPDHDDDEQNKGKSA
jgi:hypothetical protein